MGNILSIDSSEDEEEDLISELKHIKKCIEPKIYVREDFRRENEKISEIYNVFNGKKNISKKVDKLKKDLNKRWTEDVVFNNQAKELKTHRVFINDTIRSDFHRRFIDRYIK